MNIKWKRNADGTHTSTNTATTITLTRGSDLRWRATIDGVQIGYARKTLALIKGEAQNECAKI